VQSSVGPGLRHRYHIGSRERTTMIYGHILPQFLSPCSPMLSLAGAAARLARGERGHERH
jgi:hypothetical protein